MLLYEVIRIVPTSQLRKVTLIIQNQHDERLR